MLFLIWSLRNFVTQAGPQPVAAAKSRWVFPVSLEGLKAASIAARFSDITCSFTAERQRRKHFPCGFSVFGNSSPMPRTKPRNAEGRVNAPLGKAKTDLDKLAKKEGTTSTNLARVLILDGMQRIASGELRFRGPSIEPVEERSQ